LILVTGPFKVSGVKRRRVNINHVVPTGFKVDVKKGDDDEKVTEALTKAGKLEEIKTKTKPTT